MVSFLLKKRNRLTAKHTKWSKKKVLGILLITHLVVFCIFFSKIKFFLEMGKDLSSKKRLFHTNYTCTNPLQFPKPRTVTFPPISSRTRIKRYDGCLRYKCANYQEPHCRDNNFAATDYDGFQPPCCFHILRDMIREIDDAMCTLGLEYYAAYGTLLGLVRDDHVIPWTADNDFVVSFAVAVEMYERRDYLEEQFGLFLFNDFYLRSCVTDKFMDGALLPWKTDEFDKTLQRTGQFINHFPYADFFYAEVDWTQGLFIDERGCDYDKDLYFPVRRPVYNNTFHVNVPNDTDLVLSKVYGLDWRTPPINGSAHGFTSCGETPQFFRHWTPEGTSREDWIQRWNDILKRNESGMIG